MSGKDQPGKVFLSYRIVDTEQEAKELFEFLSSPGAFGAPSVFLDKRTIDWGDTWPDVLRQGLEAASVVMVLIGPDWEKELCKRHKEAQVATERGTIDWVALELQRALERLDDQKLNLLLPVLVRRDRMPDSSAVPAELSDLVKRFSLQQSHAIKLPSEGYQERLKYKLACDGGLRNHEAQVQAYIHLGKLLQQQCELPLLAALTRHWKPPQPDASTDVLGLISQFTLAVKRIEPPSTNQAPLLVDALQEVTATLYLLCVDLGLVHLWDRPDGCIPVTAADAGTAVVVKAVALKLSLAMEGWRDGTPMIQRAHHLGAAEYGLPDDVFVRLQKQAAHQILLHTKANPGPRPTGTADQLTSEHIEDAKAALKTDEANGLAHFLVFTISDLYRAIDEADIGLAHSAQSGAVRVAQSLGANLVLHHEGPWNPMRYARRDVQSRIKGALDAVAKLTK